MSSFKEKQNEVYNMNLEPKFIERLTFKILRDRDAREYSK